MSRPPVTEADFQAAVVDLAEMCGWQAMHVRHTIRGENGGWATATSIKGWPDLVLWKPKTGILHRELKTDKGRLTPEQGDVLATLKAAGADVGVWRPSDWREIEATLKGKQ